MHHASFVEGLAFHPDLDEAHGKRTGGTPFPEGLISYPQSLTHQMKVKSTATSFEVSLSVVVALWVNVDYGYKRRAKSQAVTPNPESNPVSEPP